ncbi:DUF4401 domain-containing protein [Bizionia myxarmorum]|uniref:DUF4401 domain-containing protein n=1 Tax=Bizionia myxarmorum TaxID=291186 RepID=A0A5D0RD58_9FLAO|nr:DUF4401 domain-containing protein [Bizionia myxarmorum]TYB78856.1 DUF4401 domain-containing protein [Bizionia myxarmorum]
MGKLEEKKDLLQHISAMEGDAFTFDEQAILKEYEHQNNNKSNLAIKLLSIFGGILAMLAFLGFFLITGIYDSEMGLLIFGIIFIAAAFFLDKAFNRLVTDTFSISLYIIGLVLFGFGLSEMGIHENSILIIIAVMALGSLFITQSYVLSFISIMVFNGCLISLILFNSYYHLIHLYIAGNTVLLTYVFLNEAKIISWHKIASKLYNPIRIGLIFALLAGLMAIGKRYLIPLSPGDFWLSSIIMILAVLFIVHHIIEINNVTALKSKIFIYSISCLILLLTLYAPAISGALIIILLSFLVNYKTGFVIGIVAFIYFVSQYYYDLSFTLLTKSLILIATGILFLAFYIFITKKISAHEKV